MTNQGLSVINLTFLSMTLEALCEIPTENTSLEKCRVNLPLPDSGDLLEAIWYKWNEIVGGR